MTQMRFTEEDFNTFTIEGLDARMEVLKETVRPKLTALGEHFAPTLSALTGDEMFPHVAKHARRSVNPLLTAGSHSQTAKEAIKNCRIFRLVYGKPTYLCGSRLFMNPLSKKNMANCLKQIRKPSLRISLTASFGPQITQSREYISSLKWTRNS